VRACKSAVVGRARERLTVARAGPKIPTELTKLAGKHIKRREYECAQLILLLMLLTSCWCSALLLLLIVLAFLVIAFVFYVWCAPHVGAAAPLRCAYPRVCAPARRDEEARTWTFYPRTSAPLSIVRQPHTGPEPRPLHPWRTRTPDSLPRQ